MNEHVYAIVFSRCTKCLTKNYCSKHCQQKDWKKNHMGLCKKNAEKRKMMGGQAERQQTQKDNFDKLVSQGPSPLLLSMTPHLDEVVDMCQKWGNRSEAETELVRLVRGEERTRGGDGDGAGQGVD